MSKTEKIPATKFSGLLYSISLILIVSPAFILLLFNVPSTVPSPIHIFSLIPFAAGIAMYLSLRLKKIV